MTIALVAIVLSRPEAARCQPGRQGEQPDLEMLLNFDLFRPRNSPGSQEQKQPAMFEQLRVMRNVGLLDQELDMPADEKANPEMEENDSP